MTIKVTFEFPSPVEAAEFLLRNGGQPERDVTEQKPAGKQINRKARPKAEAGAVATPASKGELPKSAVAPTTQDAAPVEASVSLDDVRKALKEVDAKLHATGVLQVLRAFDCTRIGDLMPVNYPAFIKACQAKVAGE